MPSSTNEVNNPKPKGRLSLLSKHRKANYTKHLCIDLPPKHGPLNTGIAPCIEEGRHDVDATRVSLPNDVVTKRCDILVSIAVHYGKTFISPLVDGHVTQSEIFHRCQLEGNGVKNGNILKNIDD